MNRWMIERAAPEQAAAIAALLRDAGLPTEDLASARPQFWVARADAPSSRDIAGVIGLEVFASSGLLRSLAVEKSLRRKGLGHELVTHLEQQARRIGINQLVLLTTTAADFFAAQGYSVTAREVLSPSVLASSEFRTLCPASATAMCKKLEAL